MEVTKGYKKTEIGVIPEDWEIMKLSEMTTLMTNGFVGTATSHYSEYDTDILYIQGYNVEENSFKFNGIKYVTQDFHKKHQKSCLEENDLLTIQTGDIGLTTIVPKKLEGSNCHALIITRFKRDRFNQKFYSYYLNSFIGRSRLRGIETGTTMKHINVGDMVHFTVPIPPTKGEQTAIATALSDMDALITSLENLIAKKRAIKQGAMQELLTLKKDWQIKSYGEIFVFLNTATYSRSQLSESDEIKYIHYGDIHTKWDFYLDVLNNNLPTINITQLKNYSIIKDGDVIMADVSEDYNGIGKSVEVNNVGSTKVISGLHTFLLRDVNNEFIDGFRSYIHLIKSVKKQFDELATGMKVFGVSKTNLKSVLIPIPPKPVQIHIVNILKDMDFEISIIEQKLSKYKYLKQGMMQTLLTGKIRLI